MSLNRTDEIKFIEDFLAATLEEKKNIMKYILQVNWENFHAWQQKYIKACTKEKEN